MRVVVQTICNLQKELAVRQDYLFVKLPQLSGPLDAEVPELFLTWSASLPADCQMKQNPYKYIPIPLPPLGGGYLTLTIMKATQQLSKIQRQKADLSPCLLR